VFYVLNAKKFKQFAILLFAAFFMAGIFYVEKDNVTVFSTSVDEPSAIYSVETEKKVIALTFDISWGDKRPGPIIDVLKDKGVEDATFFISSPWTKSHPDIVKTLVEEGFEIGSHGHKHVNYSSLNDEEIRKQIRTAHQIIAEETGLTPNLIRMPNGDFDKRVLSIAKDQNYTVIQWDTDSHDWMNKGEDYIVNRVVKKAHPGDIVLLHASDSCKQTHLALPRIIDQLRAKGYEFVTVSELINHTYMDKEEVKDNQKPKAKEQN
jgi:polysaccharide deacetylase family sporulation protein PdaB